MTLLPWPDLPRATVANYRKWRDTQQGRDVYAAFRAKAREIRGKGWTHFGAKAIAEQKRTEQAPGFRIPPVRAAVDHDDLK